MVNPPSLLSDNWFVFAGSGGIVIFVAALGAMAVNSGDDLPYVVELMYVGLGLFIVATSIWGIYRLLRRFGVLGPAPQDLQQVQEDLNGLQNRVDDITGLNDRVSELEREIRERQLNEADNVFMGDENDVTIIQQ